VIRDVAERAASDLWCDRRPIRGLRQPDRGYGTATADGVKTSFQLIRITKAYHVL
jgi:hypothetical protein